MPELIYPSPTVTRSTGLRLVIHKAGGVKALAAALQLRPATINGWWAVPDHWVEYVAALYELPEDAVRAP